MSRHLLIAFTNAVQGKEEEYNRWYEQRHIPDVLKIPGFVGARRFRTSTCQMSAMNPPWEYLVIYEIEGGDPEAALEELGRRIGTEVMPLSDGLAPEIGAWTYSAIDEEFPPPSLFK